MALTYQPDIPYQAGQIVTVSDDTDAQTPNKKVRVPAVVMVDATGAVVSGGGSSAAPTYVASVGGAATSYQVALAANTVNRFTTGATAFTQGVVITSLASNTASVEIGGATVTTTVNGTGNGYILPPGGSLSLSITDLSTVYLISTAAAVLSAIGN